MIRTDQSHCQQKIIAVLLIVELKYLCRKLFQWNLYWFIYIDWIMFPMKSTFLCYLLFFDVLRFCVFLAMYMFSCINFISISILRKYSASAFHFYSPYTRLHAFCTGQCVAYTENTTLCIVSRRNTINCPWGWNQVASSREAMHD